MITSANNITTQVTAKNVRFEEIRRLLEDYDFVLNRTKGSHHSFVGHINDEKITIVIPFKKPLKEFMMSPPVRASMGCFFASNA